MKVAIADAAAVSALSATISAAQYVDGAAQALRAFLKIKSLSASSGTYSLIQACRPQRVCGVWPVSRFIVTAIALLMASVAHAESGLASYYGGRGHHGEMTCAHRTRPFGSMVTVTYAGHSIQCRVNDRGPFIRGRIIDLSTAAAGVIGMRGAGVARVTVERLGG